MCPSITHRRPPFCARRHYLASVAARRALPLAGVAVSGESFRIAKDITVRAYRQFLSSARGRIAAVAGTCAYARALYANGIPFAEGAATCGPHGARTWRRHVRAPWVGSR